MISHHNRYDWVKLINWKGKKDPCGIKIQTPAVYPSCETYLNETIQEK